MPRAPHALIFAEILYRTDAALLRIGLGGNRACIGATANLIVVSESE